MELRSLEGNWPHITVVAFVTDVARRNIVMLKRGENVRSVKNVWTVPTGLLDIGEPLEAALVREVHEELGLTVRSVEPTPVVQWENITYADGFHWVLVGRHVVVDNIHSVKNMEPKKHDAVLVVPIPVFLQAARKCGEGTTLLQNGVPLSPMAPHDIEPFTRMAMQIMG